MLSVAASSVLGGELHQIELLPYLVGGIILVHLFIILMVEHRLRGADRHLMMAL